jgi:thioredoxin 1
MMVPVLEDLRKTYAGNLEVQVIDVGENPDAGRAHGISIIPTQIFFDAAGKERFRHEGFMSKEDILAKWKELGIELTAVAGSGAGPTPAKADPARTENPR